MILIVDDMQQNLFLLRSMLEGHGYEVSMARNGQEALEKARQSPPTLIISDILMPVMDGFMLCREWKNDPVLKNIPFIFYTATYVTPRDEQFALKLGADAFVTKPAQTDAFLEKIKSILSAKSHKHGKPNQQAEEDNVLVKEYSDRLINKLQEKIVDLQSSRLKADREQQKLFMAMEVGGVGMWEWDISTGCFSLDDTLLKTFDFTRETYDGYFKTLRERIHPDDLKKLDENFEQSLVEHKIFSQEVRLMLPDGSTHWVDSRGRFQYNDMGEATHGYGVAMDISDRKQNEQRIQYLAYFDALTGMPNRNLFQDRAKQALAAAVRDNHEVSFMLMDLDYFKTVNDSLGHSAGDKLLQIVAHRLLELGRDTDTVARIGGDEFILLLTEAGIEGATRVARKILNVFSEPLDIDGHKLNVGASIGISVFPQDANDYESLLRNADTALYRAKDVGRNTFQFFTSEMNAAAIERLNIEGALHQAMDSREFVVYYQPQISLTDGKIIGVEALIRWKDQKHGWVSPNKFIPIAESLGLITPIGAWVLREACHQNKKWQQSGVLQVPISVNISATQFQQDSFVSTVFQTLDTIGLSAEFLELEVTESVLIGNTDSIRAKFQQLKDVGVKFAIDDFGTGYSNLAYLKHFPVGKLKIDQSFISNIHEDGDNLAIAKAVINIGHSLRLKVIAEGIEKQSQMTLLNELSCDEGQGYLYAVPMPAEALPDWLTKYRQKLEIQPS